MFSASVYPVDGAGDIFSGCLLGRGIPDQLAFDFGFVFSTCAGRQPVGISAQVLANNLPVLSLNQQSRNAENEPWCYLNSSFDSKPVKIGCIGESKERIFTFSCDCMLASYMSVCVFFPSLSLSFTK